MVRAGWATHLRGAGAGREEDEVGAVGAPARAVVADALLRGHAPHMALRNVKHVQARRRARAILLHARACGQDVRQKLRRVSCGRVRVRLLRTHLRTVKAASCPLGETERAPTRWTAVRSRVVKGCGS